MDFNIVEDIFSVSELKRNTNSVIKQVHKTGRPVILTVNGRAEAVVLDAVEYEKHMSAFELMPLLIEAEEDIKKKDVKEVKKFFNEFRRERNI